MISYDEINVSWAKDIEEYKEGDMMVANRNIPSLHHKYYLIYSEYANRIIRLENEFKVLEKKKREYYGGTMDTAEIKQLGWEIQPLKIMKVDIQRYVDSDDDIIKLNTRIAFLKETAKYVENIIKRINQMSYEIKNHIEFVKLQQGII